MRLYFKHAIGDVYMQHFLSNCYFDVKLYSIVLEFHRRRRCCRRNCLLCSSYIVRLCIDGTILVEKIFFHPWSQCQSGTQMNRYKESGNIGTGKDEHQDSRTISCLVDNIQPVSSRLIQSKGGYRKGHDPKGKLGQNVPKRSSDTVFLTSDIDNLTSPS